jgi:DNA-binding MurR/RpiR family transcriptional regulator
MDENTEEKNVAEAQLETLARQKFQQRMAQHNEETRQQMIQAMRDNNADPAYIYAFEKTGILVFQETMDLLEPEQLEQWAQAYEEYSEN